MNTTTHRIIVSWRPVAAAVCVAMASLGGGSAWADEDNTPLSLTLSQSVNRDWNFARNDAVKDYETVFTTAGELKLDKDYGRQNYHAGLKLSKSKYHHHSNLDNDGKNFDGSFSTEMLRNWVISASGLYSEALNPIENNSATDRVQKNIRKYRDGGFSVQYGNGGTWIVQGSYDKNKQTYSVDSQAWQNSDQKVVGLKAIYLATDLLRYSLGVRRVVTDYPNNGESYSQIVDRNIDGSITWQITGLSKLNATLTRRSTSYTPDTIGAAKGWTGEASWAYTPHGMLSYDLNFRRTTGTDRSLGPANGVYTGANDNLLKLQQGQIYGLSGANISNDTITTELNATAKALLTGKVTLSYSYGLTNFKVDRSADLGGLADFQVVGSNLPKSSYNHQNVVSMNYAATRSLGFGCSYHRYSQGQDIYRIYRYHGRSVDCSATFNLDSI